MSTRELRDLLTTAYWNNRPSFARAQKKAARLLVELDRDAYDRVMEDIRHLKALLKEAQVDESKFAVESMVVNRWSHDNFQVKAFLKARGTKESLLPDGLFDEGPRLTLASTATTTHRPEAFLIPDMHFGFKAWISGPDPELRWKTVHDPAAWAVMLVAIQRTRPRRVVILGDFLDLPTFSRWPTNAEDKHLLNSTLAAAYRALCQLKQVVPDDCKIDFLEGNHEQRIRKLIEATMPDLGYMVDGANPLSIDKLLGLSDLDISYHGPYGAKVPLDNDVYATHGTLIGRRGGESAGKVLAAGHESCAFGHTHRVEVGWGAWADCHGKRHLYWAMGCGTGARVDGTAPGSSNECNWQQGFGIYWGRNAPDVYVIEDGRCNMQGTVIDVDGLA